MDAADNPFGTQRLVAPLDATRGDGLESSQRLSPIGTEADREDAKGRLPGEVVEKEL